MSAPTRTAGPNGHSDKADEILLSIRVGQEQLAILAALCNTLARTDLASERWIIEAKSIMEKSGDRECMSLAEDAPITTSRNGFFDLGEFSDPIGHAAVALFAAANRHLEEAASHLAELQDGLRDIREELERGGAR